MNLTTNRQTIRLEDQMARIEQHTRMLTEVAKNLNASRDHFGKTIERMDKALQRMNIGISCWTVWSGGGVERGERWERLLGYAKIGGKWGLALRQVTYQRTDQNVVDTTEDWRMGDAPSWMRTDCLNQIPELLRELIDRSETMIEKTFQADERLSQFCDVVERITESH